MFEREQWNSRTVGNDGEDAWEGWPLTSGFGSIARPDQGPDRTEGKFRNDGSIQEIHRKSTGNTYLVMS